jgi:hypothetical protein
VRLFKPGESVVLREIWQGGVWAARAATIVDDAADQTAFYLPVGTPCMAPQRNGRFLRMPEADFVLTELRLTDAHILSFAWPDVAQATLLVFRPDWRVWDWYVNLQEPLRRGPLGFDTVDHVLDVVVELDGSWRWKDEDELAEAIRRGLIPPEEEPRLRAEGELAVRRIVDRESPFDRDWTTWRPDPSWPTPTLPSGWDRVREG